MAFVLAAGDLLSKAETDKDPKAGASLTKVRRDCGMSIKQTAGTKVLAAFPLDGPAALDPPPEFLEKLPLAIYFRSGAFGSGHPRPGASRRQAAQRSVPDNLRSASRTSST